MSIWNDKWLRCLKKWEMKFFSLLFFSFALACSNSGSSDAVFSEAKMAEPEMVMDYELDEVVEGNVLQESEPKAQEQKIIKTGRLSFETQTPDATHQRILELTKQYKGFVQSDNSGKSYNRIFRNIVVRVPTENFQSYIDGISEGVQYFDQKDISRQDVSEEFVDLTARLKAKRELENRYLELLKQAKNVKEMLEIERELSTIREEIEAKQGRLNYLQNKVSLSTVYIDFYKTTTETGVTVSYWQKMKNALKGGWDGISVFFLGLLYLWPLFLLILIAVLVIRRFIKSRKNKMTNS